MEVIDVCVLELSYERSWRIRVIFARLGRNEPLCMFIKWYTPKINPSSMAMSTTSAKYNPKWPAANPVPISANKTG